jgi:microcystin-dependent protein
MDYIVLTNQNLNLAVNDRYVSPAGLISCYAGQNAPDGWLICDGSEVSKVTYSSLFSVIGNNYGSPTNPSNFALPNLTQKFPLGKSGSNNLGNSSGNSTITLTTNQLPSHSHTGTTNSNGLHSHTGNTNTTGTHTHSINDPGHTHTQTTINDDFNNSGGNPPGFGADSAGIRIWQNIDYSFTGITLRPDGDHSHSLNTNEEGSHTHTFTTNSTGSGSSINIMNPYLVVNYIIKY